MEIKTPKARYTTLIFNKMLKAFGPPTVALREPESHAVALWWLSLHDFLSFCTAGRCAGVVVRWMEVAAFGDGLHETTTNNIATTDTPKCKTDDLIVGNGMATELYSNIKLCRLKMFANASTKPFCYYSVTNIHIRKHCNRHFRMLTWYDCHTDELFINMCRWWFDMGAGCRKLGTKFLENRRKKLVWFSDLSSHAPDTLLECHYLFGLRVEIDSRTEKQLLCATNLL